MTIDVLDQGAVETGEGPIGLVMAPTRELASQIHIEFNKFCPPLGLRVRTTAHSSCSLQQ